VRGRAVSQALAEDQSASGFTAEDDPRAVARRALASRPSRKGGRGLGLDGGPLARPAAPAGDRTRRPGDPPRGRPRHRRRAGGVITTGGSLANLIATITARRVRFATGREAFEKGVIYTSDQAHHSVLKAALLSGFDADRVRFVATDDRYRMLAADLEGLMER